MKTSVLDREIEGECLHFPVKRQAPTVSYSILGPLAVHYGDAVVTPKAYKVRVILAVLLARINSVVSVDTLIQELWGEDPPRTALQAVRVYISQLRQMLNLCPDRAIGPRVVTQSPGYVLEMDPELLDAAQFERLCRLGQRAHAKQDLPAAREFYRSALRLWRGNPLSDVRSGPQLQGTALKFDDMWITMLLSRIDIDMRLGHYEYVVSELRELEAAYPLHEGLHARLMIALFNDGRTKDALGVYKSIRTALVEELGVEPQASLRNVHELILKSDGRRLLHPSALAPVPGDLAASF